VGIFFMAAVTLVTREQIAEHFGVTLGLLMRYEARGLLQVAGEGGVEGYDRAQVRRLWSIVSLQRDLGINLAGVEAILRLRDQLEQMHEQIVDLASALREALEAESEPHNQG
jgi:MerR family transcriptional regulator/heat shock protein HspR